MSTNRSASASRASSWPGIASALVLLATFSAGCNGAGASDRSFFFFEDAVIGPGEEAPDSLLALGGSIRVEGTARRNVVVVGGDLAVLGSVGGDVTLVDGALHLGGGARIEGGVSLYGAVELNRSPRAQIRRGARRSSAPFWAFWSDPRHHWSASRHSFT